jgi:ABC-2 type transport system ATP-binding protein/lipopolysaccharide transport system ATP-binding protein
LRILAGIFVPNNGRVEVTGDVVTMFDSGFGLDLESDAESNVRFRGMLLGKNKIEIVQAVKSVKDFVELGERWGDPLRTYSSGMISRVIVSLATAFDSEILLMDEGIGASDINFQEKASMRFKELLSKTGTIVMATHNQQLMEEFCTKAYLMDKGQIVAEGSVSNIWKKYRSSNL